MIIQWIFNSRVTDNHRLYFYLNFSNTNYTAMVNYRVDDDNYKYYLPHSILDTNSIALNMTADSALVSAIAIGY